MEKEIQWAVLGIDSGEEWIAEFFQSKYHALVTQNCCFISDSKADFSYVLPQTKHRDDPENVILNVFLLCFLPGMSQN